MRNLVISVLVIGLLSLVPLSPRVAPSSGLLPVSISVGQDEANAYTYRRARVTYRRAYRRGYRRAYYGGAYYRPYTYGHYRRVGRRVARRGLNHEEGSFPSTRRQSDTMSRLKTACSV